MKPKSYRNECWPSKKITRASLRVIIRHFQTQNEVHFQKEDFDEVFGFPLFFSSVGGDALPRRDKISNYI